MNTSESKAMQKTYSTPALKKWGSVTDLTLTGGTSPGNDGKDGSVGHSKGG